MKISMNSPARDPFLRISNALVEALFRARLSGAQWRVLLWVIRYTLGWNRRSASFTWYRVAKEIGLDRSTACRAGHALLRAGVLVLAGSQIEVQEDSQSWGTGVLSPHEVASQQLWMPGMDDVRTQRKPVSGCNATVARRQRFSVELKTVVKTVQRHIKTSVFTEAGRHSSGARERAQYRSIYQEPPDLSRGNMTAFLKIDECQSCHRSLPWEWVPAVLLNGKSLAGTGVWRSQLTQRRCPACQAALERAHEMENRVRERRRELVELLGGERPYREFTFERYQVAPGNQLAYERSKNFNPAGDNLYLWGACGVGKTHLAYAVARRCFEESLSVTMLLAGQISRKVRMKDPEQEQAAIDNLVQVEVLVLDDVGTGTETAYTRQILQEILDCRNFWDRAGLVITSKFSLDALAEKLNDDAIPSRLASVCQVIEVKGIDHRSSVLSSH